MTPVVLLLKVLHLKKFKETVNKMTIIFGYIDPWRLAAVEKMSEGFISPLSSSRKSKDRQYNAQNKSTKGKRTIYKTLHRKLKIE